MENTITRKEANRNRIIGVIFWLLSSVLAFISFNAFITMLGRIYSYFFLTDEYYAARGSYSVQQFAVIPAGLMLLVAVIAGAELISRHAADKPERIWNFYSLIFSLEFIILFLAAKI